ncbi:hypothetical protein KXD40_004631 [Peronospora effusa]|nr:hypothetical protein KXD40_004631 [Peronospora effusa]
MNVPGVGIPSVYCDRMERLLAEFITYARDDTDRWQLQTQQRGVHVYVRRASRLGVLKGVGFIAQHPYKVLELVLDLSRRHTYDPQLLATQRVHVFNDHTWVDHLTYKAAFPVAAMDFVNLTHWRVLADGSILIVATDVGDNTFVKNQKPHIVHSNIILTGFLITPNEDYTGVNVTYITKVDVKTGISASLQTKMLIKQAFVVDRLRKVLDQDESLRQCERVTNATLLNISTTACVEDENEEASAMRLQSTKTQDQNGQREPLSSGFPVVIPEEGFPAVLEEYSEIIEKTVAQMEAELNDETSWDFIGDKDGVKAYTKVDGSLTAAKGVGFLPYHPRVIWDHFIDATKRKLVDHQLALGRKLKTLDAQTHIDYLEYKPIFVVAGRDFCNLVHWRVLSGGTIIVVVQSIEDLELCPLKEPKVVRGDLHLACTKIVPNAAYDGAMVTTMVKTDLKGSIPARIAGKVAAEQPFVISRMGEIIKARRDLAEVAAQGKLTNTVFELPNKQSLSSGSVKTVRSSVINGAAGSRNLGTSLSGSATFQFSGNLSQMDTFSRTSGGKLKVSKTQASKPETIGVSVEVMDHLKMEQKTMSDVAMYAIQFGGAILALKSVDLPTAMHFVIMSILFFALKVHVGPSQTSSQRKTMISTFGPPDSDMIFGTLQLDMTKANQYIAARRINSDWHLTATHIVLLAFGKALSMAPYMNDHLVFGSYYPAPTVDISCLVALGDGKDFGVCRLRDIDKMNLQDVDNCLRGVSTKMCSGQGDRNKSMSLLPTWVIRLMRNVFGWLGGACGVRIPQVGKDPFMFGSCMVTSVDMMGLDMAFSSIPLYSQVPMLVNIGSILDKAVVVNDKVEVRPMLTLTTTVDHQYANSCEVARMAKSLKEFVENPSLLEVIHGA